ncbi:MAG: valine--tRNA ligase [Chlamydiae bacterium]|nr:valine--tRNA ligase [Chlamydiota bacterium]
MSQEELPKAFVANTIEEKWSKFWEEEKFFHADANSPKPSFSLVMPPPNVTGVLHMGHALVNTLQDVLTRWKRMKGFEVLWIPGTDHAGIATQTVVERQLIATQGKRRKDFSREEFLRYVWDWKEKSQGSILGQLRKLGCSCDWSRLCFTLDDQRSYAVQEAFKRLFDQGMIYRGDYLVNWDPVTQTALADDEVEYEEKNSFLWHLRYPLTDGSGHITVATTRPETMLGDAAIAVSPQDERYKHLVGKSVQLPLTGRVIPILADRRIDSTFGSGAVKVTPAHDPNDYEMGIEHDLPMINIMTPEGKINEVGGVFAGLSIEEARAAVVEAMNQQGLLAKIEPYKHRVGVSYRSKAVIEPMLSKQWFVRMSAYKERLRTLVENKTVHLLPETWEGTYFYWIDNLKDWCISRQLWWGHRIPIWYCKEDPNIMLCHVGEGAPEQVQKNPSAWTQDEDVLDTWFSSALWPLSVLGWPGQTKDLEKFYPNSTLITGHDILFFWVARMIFMGDAMSSTPPFPETFLHGLIYGKSYWTTHEGAIHYVTGEERLAYDLGKPLPPGVQCRWEKMSKSKGNVIDPIEIIDTFGADAMRMALCSSATQARQIDLDRRRFEEYKNFANKIWNGARFVFMHLEDLEPSSLAQGIDENLYSLEDRWILSLLCKTIQQVEDALSSYHFDKAATLAYDFFWREFCAYYVEISKPCLLRKVGSPSLRENKQKLLAIILHATLRLLHPMAPFITEELFSLLRAKFLVEPASICDPLVRESLIALQAKACAIAPYPSLSDRVDPAAEKTFLLLETVLTALRNLRAEMQLPPSTATDVWILGDPAHAELQEIMCHGTILTSLVKVHQLTQKAQDHPLPPLSASKWVGSLQILIPLPEELKLKEKERLTKEIDRLHKQLSSLHDKLHQEEFRQRAPMEIIAKLDLQQKDLSQALEDAKMRLLSLGNS